jgi:hypothetical protein
MYAGAFVMLLGIPIALGSWWGLLVIAAMMPALIWRLIDEEKFRARNLPGYVEYQKKSAVSLDTANLVTLINLVRAVYIDVAERCVIEDARRGDVHSFAGIVSELPFAPYPMAANL